ncbi:zinc finger protein 385D isoform X2 [Brienomyrus brachyistius]|uniref:zinc finger protein 385D isoform X2 n=1 Tax=Brienomyrus brachyistius TaxID=42636 RepID=UPI0020B2BC7E|nr:zinc finger protein 385D isoform X2 [Brienomyrus brachyistius]
MYFGSACQSTILPALMRPPVANVQPSLGTKQFLPLALDTAMQVNLLPNFRLSIADLPPAGQSLTLSKWKRGQAVGRLNLSLNQTQKAAVTHTLGIPLLPQKKHVVSCSVCKLKFNSESQASAHYNGIKHAKRLKALGALKCEQNNVMVTKESTKGSQATLPPTGPETTGSLAGVASLPSSPSSVRESASLHDVPEKPEAPVVEGRHGSPESDSSGEPGEETEEEKARRLLYCSLCKVAVNSASQLEAHNVGAKHKTMLEARTGNGTIKSFPRPGVKGKLSQATKACTGLQNRMFHCETCDVHVNSETQLKQHISSRRHKDRAAGKPPKPKYNPYSKAQKGQTVNLGLKKGLDQPLPACLLPSPLAPVAPHFPLRSSPAALFQTPPLPAPLLRPAPGPIRTPSSPVLFAPY